MFEMDLGDDIEFKVTLNGKAYTLREPTVAEIDGFRAGSETDGVKTLVRLLTTLGMPEEIVLSMGMTKAKRLVDGLMDELTKKK